MQVPQLVNQTNLHGVLTGPHAAAGNGVNLLVRHSSTVSHEAYKLLINVRDAFVHGRHLDLIKLGFQPNAGMRMGAHIVVRQAHFVLQELLGVWKHAKDSNGSRDGVGGSEDFLGTCADVIATACCVIAHAHHEGLAGFLQEFSFPPDDVTRQGRTARAAHPQHHSFNVGGQSCLADGLGQGHRTNGLVVAHAHLDAACCVDNGQRTAEGFRFFGFTVRGVVHGFENAEVKLRSKTLHRIGIHILREVDVNRLLSFHQFLDAFFQLVFIEQAIEQLPFHAVFRGAQDQVLRCFIQSRLLNASALSNAPADFAPKVIQHRRQLLAVRCTHAGPRKRLHGAFVLVVGTAQHGHAHSEFFEHALVISGLQSHATEVRAAIRVQVQLVCNRGHIQPSHGHGLGPPDNPLAGRFEVFQGVAQVCHGRGRCGHRFNI